jgi:hypothetical protein
MSHEDAEDETPDVAEQEGGAQESPAEEEGPDAAELDKDPAYNPEDENLKGLKGG